MANETGAKGWKALGWAEIIILFFMLVLSWTHHVWPPWLLIWLSVILIGVSSFICFRIKEGGYDSSGKLIKDTSENWKLGFSIVSIIGTLLIYLIPISVQAIK